MNRIQHIIWDFNGTLLDDVELCINIMNRLLIKRGLPLLDRARYSEVFQFPVIHYYQALGFDFQQDPFKNLAQEYITPYNKSVRHCSLYPGAFNTLAYFKEGGIKQYILSAFEHDELMQVLKHLDILHYFDDVTGLDNQHAASKLQQGSQLLKANAINPETALIIGDTHHDYDVANELNTHCLLIDHGHQSRQKLMALTQQVVSDFEQIYPFVQSFELSQASV
ncbi:HAD family hydrolase [Reinekea marina]|uniref:phosphoglycolate phosphatase n=1 Tax=Reinekea marina TaxID=1310421 RepID=A0ABV7WTQ2_9GAMM|nr:HAD family hydrolase [Reinekea marina]MDN3651005.1 HAD family hydrolase [Reinekea marina]